MYKNASDKEIISWLERCKSFDYNHYTEYCSELSHRMKTYGDDFISLYGTDAEYKFALSLGDHCALFLCTLIKYLSHKQGVDFDSFEVSKHFPSALDFALFASGTAEMCDELEDIGLARDDLNVAIQEFLDVGLVVSDETLYGSV